MKKSPKKNLSENIKISKITHLVAKGDEELSKLHKSGHKKISMALGLHQTPVRANESMAYWNYSKSGLTSHPEGQC